MESKYFDFKEWITEGKPIRYRVEKKDKTGICTIGIIAWNDEFQSYGFAPNGGLGDVIIFLEGLTDIKSFIENLMFKMAYANSKDRNIESYKKRLNINNG